MTWAWPWPGWWWRCGGGAAGSQPNRSTDRAPTALKTSLTWEPVSGFEPLACRLQEVRPSALSARPARIPQTGAAMALISPGFTSKPVHEPVHDSHSDRRMLTTERYRGELRRPHRSGMDDGSGASAEPGTESRSFTAVGIGLAARQGAGRLVVHELMAQAPAGLGPIPRTTFAALKPLRLGQYSGSWSRPGAFSGWRRW